MNSFNPDQLLSFLRQNPTLLAQLFTQPGSYQPPQPSSAAPVEPASAQAGTVGPQPLHFSVPFPPSQQQPPPQPAAASPFTQPAVPPPPLPVAQSTPAVPVTAAPIRPYSSLNMLAGVTARTPQASSVSGFPSQTVIGRMNQERLEHASSSGDSSSSSEPKRRTRKKAKHAPALQAGAVTPTINHTMNTAEDGVAVINLEVLVRFAMPSRPD